MKRIIGVVSILFILLALASPPCRAAIGAQTTGREPHLFDLYTGPTGNGQGSGCNIIIARVVALSKAKEGSDLANNGYRDLATLEPLATLAGLLDPSLRPKVDVGLWISDAPGFKTTKLPPVGAIVLAMIMANDQTIFPETCPVMPDGSGLVVLDGVGDRRVHETLERIRVARAAAKAQEEADVKRVETQPAADTNSPAPRRN